MRLLELPTNTVTEFCDYRLIISRYDNKDIFKHKIPKVRYCDIDWRI